MSAVEGTREARERALRLLAEVGAGRITRSFSGWFLRLGPDHVWDSVGEQDRKALQELRGSGLVDANESDTAGPGQMMSVWLTAKGGDALLVPAPESSCGDPR